MDNQLIRSKHIPRSNDACKPEANVSSFAPDFSPSSLSTDLVPAERMVDCKEDSMENLSDTE